mmetsp:Transcript_12134/g.18133  ORF Transcript_12134/g.18133 Transcript_12134/m.18133 type:complete len:164 (+) Transcript_12134:83-574(+)|eukprot:CAMPEP_0171464406 /NCGR_PEP_ID=MMETSP0945-20130129/7741_1 /TAXON_ID=109269 /ORGANISM="Vaucheria litorea, Strain CCMP2940" /LENGTH=163 /DNA_ID=CAMNT_0011991495 /DNA_START=79 /DNA_END=570 /DNA_ORIENTATION=+
MGSPILVAIAAVNVLLAAISIGVAWISASSAGTTFSLSIWQMGSVANYFGNDNIVVTQVFICLTLVFAVGGLVGSAVQVSGSESAKNAGFGCHLVTAFCSIVSWAVYLNLFIDMPQQQFVQFYAAGFGLQVVVSILALVATVLSCASGSAPKGDYGAPPQKEP